MLSKKPRVLVRKSVGRDSKCAAIRLRGGDEELLAAISPDLTLPTAVTLRTIIYARGRGQRTQDREREAYKQFMVPIQLRPCLIVVKVSARRMENVKASVVVNYDFPENMEEYERRLKLAEGGNLWSYFIASKDKKLAEGLIKVLLNTKQEVNRSLIQCWLDYEKSLTQLDLPCDYLVILRCPR